MCAPFFQSHQEHFARPPHPSKTNFAYLRRVSAPSKTGFRVKLHWQHECDGWRVRFINLAAKKAACLCDMVISAFTRNSPEGADAMAVRAGLYSGPDRRDTTPPPTQSSTPVAADSSASTPATSAPRETAPAASSPTVAA